MFAALLDNVPVVDGQDYTQFVAGIALQDAMQTPLAKVESIITGHSFKYAQYANFVVAAPAIAIEEDQQIVATAQSNEEAYDEVTLTDDQVAGVLDMGLPEVKATASGLELHFVDALPYPLNMAYVALIKGLLYNADNLNALYEFVINLSKRIAGYPADQRHSRRHGMQIQRRHRAGSGQRPVLYVHPPNCRRKNSIIPSH